MKRVLIGLGLVAVLAIGVGMAQRMPVWMGRQPDGGFLVSSGQRIEGGSIAFDGRPSDLALHPSGKFYAVLHKSRVFLGDSSGVIRDSEAPLGCEAGFHGLAWSPDGTRLFASTAKGHVQAFALSGKSLRAEATI